MSRCSFIWHCLQALKEHGVSHNGLSDYQIGTLTVTVPDTCEEDRGCIRDVALSSWYDYHFVHVWQTSLSTRPTTSTCFFSKSISCASRVNVPRTLTLHRSCALINANCKASVQLILRPLDEIAHTRKGDTQWDTGVILLMCICRRLLTLLTWEQTEQRCVCGTGCNYYNRTGVNRSNA